MALIGALNRVRADDGPWFLVKGGVSIELRIGRRVRATKDVDLVFRGDADEMLDAWWDAFKQPFAGSHSDARARSRTSAIQAAGDSSFSSASVVGSGRWCNWRMQSPRPMRSSSFRLLEELLGDDLAEVREAAEAVFIASGKHEWPPELVDPESWREPYARTATETDADLPPAVDRAAEWVRALVARIEASRAESRTEHI
jgi:hypothetical protein